MLILDENGPSKSAKANDEEIDECIQTVKKVNCPTGENKEDAITIAVKSDCSVNTNCSVDDGEKNIAKPSFVKEGGTKKEDLNEKKTKWNFSWKGKMKKTKAVDVCHDSDSDFETNNVSTDTNSKSCSLDKSGTKSRKKKATKVLERTTKLCTNVARSNRSNKTSNMTHANSETKTCSKVSDLANISTSKLEPCLLGEYENDSISIQNITKSSCNDKVSKNFDGEIAKVNLESCDKIEAEGSCQNTIVSPLSRTRESKNCVLRNDSVFVQSFAEDSTDKKTTENVGYNSAKASSEKYNDQNSVERTKDKETIKAKEGLKTETSCKSSDMSKSGSESPKKSYFDILMQSSKAKAFEQQVSCEIGGQVRQDKSDNDCCEKTAKRNKLEDVLKSSDKKRKTSKTRRKKISGCEENISETDGNESAKNEKNGKTIRRSARKTRRKNVSETICESDLKDEVDIECSEAKVENRPLIRTRRSRTLTSTIKESVEEGLVAASSDEQREREKNVEKGELLKGKQEDLQLMDTEGGSESKVADSSQSCNEIKDVSGDYVASNQNKRSKRLR